MAHYSTRWLSFFLLISRMHIFIFLLLSTTITFYGLFGNTNLFSEGFAFGVTTAPVAFPSLPKPILILCICNLTLSKHNGKGHESFCTVFWFIFILHINFFKSGLFITLHIIFQDHFRIEWTCQSLCQMTNFLRYSSWLILCYRGILLQAIRYGCAQICQYCCVIQGVMLNVYHSPADLLFLSTFLFQHGVSFRNCHGCSIVQFLCNFPFQVWLSLQLLHLLLGLMFLRFRVFLSCRGHWSGSMCNS